MTQFLKLQNASEHLLHEAFPSDRKNGIRLLAELQLVEEEVSRISGIDQAEIFSTKVRARIASLQKHLHVLLHADNGESHLFNSLLAQAELEDERNKLTAAKRIPACPLSSALAGRLHELKGERIFSETSLDNLQTLQEGFRAELGKFQNSFDSSEATPPAEFVSSCEKLESYSKLGDDILRRAKLEIGESHLSLLFLKDELGVQSRLVRNKSTRALESSLEIRDSIEISGNNVKLMTEKFAELEGSLENLLARTLGSIRTVSLMDNDFRDFHKFIE